MQAPAHQKKRRSALENLAMLPCVFDLRDVQMLCNLEEGSARNTVMRWSAMEDNRGNPLLVKPAGPRAGIYYNLQRDREGPRNRLHEVVQKVDKGAVVIGASALHWADWTTQLPRVLEVASTQRSFPRIEGVTFVHRPLSWYVQTKPFVKAGLCGMNTLDPAMALADAWLNRGCWRPDPDDIDLEWDDHAVGRISTALAAFGMSEQEREAKLREILALSFGGGRTYQPDLFEPSGPSR